MTSNVPDPIDPASSPRGTLPPLPPAKRRDILRRARPLKAQLQIGRAGLNDALIGQIRQALDRTPIVKVRLASKDRDEADAAGRALAGQLPCYFVDRMGFVITLARVETDGSRAPDDEQPADADDDAP